MADELLPEIAELVSDESVSARRWPAGRRTGLVAWLNPEEGAFGISFFNGFDGQGQPALIKYYTFLHELPAARPGDVVTFNVGQVGAEQITKIGALVGAWYVAVVTGLDGTSITAETCRGGPSWRLRRGRGGGSLGDARVGDFVAIALSGSVIQAGQIVGCSNDYETDMCMVCTETRPLVSVCTNGEHRYCMPCHARHMMSLSVDLQDYPLTCMEGSCKIVVHGHPRAILPSRFHERIERFTTIAALGPELAAQCAHCGFPMYASRTRADGSVVCPQCENVFCRNCGVCTRQHLGMSCLQYKAEQTRDPATERYIAATSKPCPGCGFRTTHFHGHACHHIKPGNGCSNCGVHWCYVCAGRMSDPNPDCPSHGSTYCDTANIEQNLVATPYPHDRRCGCPICNICRPGRPCEQCTGDCVVCRGVVPPGPTRLV